MAKRKRTKGQTTIYKTLHNKTKDRVTQAPLKRDKHFPALSLFLTYHRICSEMQRVPRVEQELFTFRRT
jgi:hypothetical protein